MDTMAAAHVKEKVEVKDSVFAIVQQIREAKQRADADEIVDGSIGTIRDEEEAFATLPVVDRVLRELDPAEMMDYAVTAGDPAYLEAMMEHTFQEFRPEGMYARAVATPGGSGAVRLMMSNYLEDGDTVMIPDWHWSPYRIIASEAHKNFTLYRMYDENNRFTTADIKEKAAAVLQKQDGLLVIINSPGHNPTGYSLCEEEWLDLLEFFKVCARMPGKRILLGLDVAYLDYAGDPKESRQFFRLFSHLPENMMVLVASSMSKSFLAYGLRSGALIGLSSRRELAEDFFKVNSYSCRGLWSCCNRGAQQLMIRISGDPKLKQEAEAQRSAYNELVRQRAEIFVAEAGEAGLKTLPYVGGFFIMIPCRDAIQVANALAREKIFLNPMNNGVRLALCCVPKAKLKGLAKRIQTVLSRENMER